MPRTAAWDDTLDERAQVYMKRFNEAHHEFGMSLDQAHRFAEATVDVGVARKMAARGWTGDQIAKALL